MSWSRKETLVLRLKSLQTFTFLNDSAYLCMESWLNSSCCSFRNLISIVKFVKLLSPNIVGNNTEAQEFLSRGGQVIIRMRGLPYDCTAKQVV